MSTQNVLLDVNQYVKINSGPGSFLLQSHGDTVRIVFSDVKPIKGNTAFHQLGGQAGMKSVLPTQHVETFIWALAMTTSSKLTITKLNENVPISIKDPLEPNGSIPVTLQDQTTPPFIIYASQVTNTTTLAVAAEPDDTDIEVADTNGINTGDYLGIFNTVTDAFYVGTVIDIVANVLSMDTPIDMNFDIGNVVGTGITNMNVDGSATTEVFTLRGADPGLSVTLDITRIMILCVTNTATELTDFGDIGGGLLKGLVMRRADGMINNIFNFKTNIEMKGAMYDWDALEASNPGQGVFGFSGRLTFAGQNKMGVVIRIGPGESVELLVQDNLTSLLRLNVIFEGSLAIV